jgi:hypothetical protein
MQIMQKEQQQDLLLQNTLMDGLERMTKYFIENCLKGFQNRQQ